MKKRTSLLIMMFLILSAGAAFSLDNFGLRFLGEAGVDFTGMDFYDDSGNFSWDAMDVKGVSPIYWGFTWSLAFDHFGFGSTSQVNFQGTGMDTVMEFDYSLYMTIHFFKTNRVVDWFVEAGLGVGGQLDIRGIENFHYRTNNSLDFLKMSIYPHLATGVAFKFGKKSPFTFGGRFVVKPVSGRIPYAPIGYHETSLFEASIFLGITLNFDRTEKGMEDEYEEEREEELREKYEDLLEDKDEALEELQKELEEKNADAEEEEDFELKIEEIKEEKLDDWRSDEAKELEKRAKENSSDTSINIEGEKDGIRIDININTGD